MVKPDDRVISGFMAGPQGSADGRGTPVGLLELLASPIDVLLDGNEDERGNDHSSNEIPIERMKQGWGEGLILLSFDVS